MSHRYFRVILSFGIKLQINLEFTEYRGIVIQYYTLGLTVLKQHSVVVNVLKNEFRCVEKDSAS